MTTDALTTIELPELCLVALVGPTSSGKSSFAAAHFRPTEVLSSDAFRALVSDDENSLEATADAFESLYFVAAKRLERGRLTVIDATHLRPEDRRRVVELARAHDVLPVAIALDLPPAELLARHAARSDRPFGEGVVRRQANELRRNLSSLNREGFRHVWTLKTPEDVAGVQIRRTKLYSDRRDEHGPFDFIGDVHGCLPELTELLGQLGYAVSPDLAVTPPPGRQAVFVGDLVDRGPDTPGVLRLVMGMVQAGTALCVPGNHDDKLGRALQGKKVTVNHGLERSLEQLEPEPAEFKQQVAAFLEGLTSHYVLDGGRAVVAHAGLIEKYQGRASGRVREFALYGDVDGTDAAGLPLRRNWAADYRGAALVVYGHTPVWEPTWENGTINIDTGCVFGGRLSALRYPEREVVSVPARATYAVPARPLKPAEPADGLLDLADFTGKQVVETALLGRVTLREDELAAAVEVAGRFAVDPRWLIYLPPTMSPSETSRQGGYLEHPHEAFEHYRRAGVAQLVCEEKHMGSRALLLVAQSVEVAARRFGVVDGRAGLVYSRTGRAFFDDVNLESALLDRARQAIEGAGLWNELRTDWLLLDAELLPWSFKALDLIRRQYAAVGAAATHALPAAVAQLEQAQARGLDVSGLRTRTRERAGDVRRYVTAYRQYVRRVSGLPDLRVAPFHLLAGEGQVYSDRDHLWHLGTLAKLAQAAPDLFLATEHRLVNFNDPASQAAATEWWLDLTAEGGEGMVVKPRDFIRRGPKGLVQPALKVRGREYLRLIYGPEYTRPEHLERLRERALSGKRQRALREFALGLEGLSRFVAGEPLRRVHQCALGVLALESDLSADPRL